MAGLGCGAEPAMFLLTVEDFVELSRRSVDDEIGSNTHL